MLVTRTRIPFTRLDTVTFTRGVAMPALLTLPLNVIMQFWPTALLQLLVHTIPGWKIVIGIFRQSEKVDSNEPGPVWSTPEAVPTPYTAVGDDGDRQSTFGRFVSTVCLPRSCARTM